jgi:hypothetical protein
VIISTPGTGGLRVVSACSSLRLLERDEGDGLGMNDRLSRYSPQMVLPRWNREQLQGSFLRSAGPTRKNILSLKAQKNTNRNPNGQKPCQATRERLNDGSRGISRELNSVWTDRLNSCSRRRSPLRSPRPIEMLACQSVRTAHIGIRVKKVDLSVPPGLMARNYSLPILEDVLAEYQRIPDILKRSCPA